MLRVKRVQAQRHHRESPPSGNQLRTDPVIHIFIGIFDHLDRALLNGIQEELSQHQILHAPGVVKSILQAVDGSEAQIAKTGFIAFRCVDIVEPILAALHQRRGAVKAAEICRSFLPSPLFIFLQRVRTQKIKASDLIPVVLVLRSFQDSGILLNQ